MNIVVIWLVCLNYASKMNVLASGSKYQSNSPWPHHRGLFNNNTGASPHKGPVKSQIAFTFQMNAPILSSPCIGDTQGRVYIGSQDYYIYAINPSGSQLWKYSTGSSISTNFIGVVSSPALAADGTLYVGASDGYLYAIASSTGTLIDAFRTYGGISSSPTIGNDGSIYFGSGDGCVYALKVGPGGFLTQTWSDCSYYISTQTLSPISYSSPAFSASGTIMYIGSQNSYLYALYAVTGSLVWVFRTTDSILSTPAVGSDGTVYVGSLDNCTYAIWPSGSLKWKYRTGGSVVASPAIGIDGTVYIGSQDGTFYAFMGQSGSIKWTFSMTNPIQSSAVIDSVGTLYVGSENNYLYSLSSYGSMLWKFNTAGMTVSSPVIGTDGTLYVGSDNNFLYAFNDAYSSAPSTSPARLPSRVPTVAPTKPTINPSYLPTKPTSVPVILPTSYPTMKVSNSPTSTTATSKVPSVSPSNYPTVTPSILPTQRSVIPTMVPSLQPIVQSTYKPSTVLTSTTTSPSNYPTSIPSILPIQLSFIPTNVPSLQPTVQSTFNPSIVLTSTAPVSASFTPTMVTLTSTAAPTISMQPTLLTAGNSNKGSSFASLSSGTQAGIIIAIILAIIAIFLLIAYFISKNKHRDMFALDSWIKRNGNQDNIIVLHDNTANIKDNNNYSNFNSSAKSGHYVVSPLVDDDGRDSPTSSVSSAYKPTGISLSPHPHFDDTSSGWRHSVDSHSEGRI